MGGLGGPSWRSRFLFARTRFNIQPAWSRQNMIFERTIIYSIYNPYSIYFRMVVTTTHCCRLDRACGASEGIYGADPSTPSYKSRRHNRLESLVPLFFVANLALPWASRHLQVVTLKMPEPFVKSSKPRTSLSVPCPGVEWQRRPHQRIAS